MPCSPRGGRWFGRKRTTWLTVCSSAPHSQAAEEAISHLCKQERASPTPVRRRLSRTHAVLSRAIPGEWVPVSGMKVRWFVVLSNNSTFHRWSAQSAARMLSVELRRCCGAGTYGCLDLRRRAFPLDVQVSSGADVQAPWQGVLETVAYSRRSSAGWVPARTGMLSTGVGRRHPVSIRKASLMVGSVRRVWALRH